MFLLVSRCFEEYRGFPQAVEAFSILLQNRSNLHIVIVGQDGTADGNLAKMERHGQYGLQNFRLSY